LYLVHGVHGVQAFNNGAWIPEKVPFEAHYRYTEWNSRGRTKKLVELEGLGGLVDEEVLRGLALQLKDIC